MKQEMTACALRVGPRQVNAEPKPAPIGLGGQKGFADPWPKMIGQPLAAVEHVKTQSLAHHHMQFHGAVDPRVLLCLEGIANQIVQHLGHGSYGGDDVAARSGFVREGHAKVRREPWRHDT